MAHTFNIIAQMLAQNMNIIKYKNTRYNKLQNIQKLQNMNYVVYIIYKMRISKVWIC